MSNHIIESRLDEGICVVRLNRPPANALNAAFLLEIEACFAALESDASARAVVLTGEGRALSAGMDLKELPHLNADGRRDTVDALNLAYGRLYGFAKPLVAAVNGHAIAGGLFFVLTADYRVAADVPAQFGLSEIRVAVPFPVSAMEIARAELSPAMARRILLGGRPIDVAEATANGIIDETCAPESLIDRACEIARTYAASPPTAYAVVKHQLRADVLQRIRTVIAEKSDPVRDDWFTPETLTAAQAVLAGKG